MTVKFDVTPEGLESSANRIEGKAKEFANAHNRVYEAISELRTSFKGIASDELNRRIEQYKNDFANADKALAEYVNFLRIYANNIKKAENSIQSNASRLSVGK